MRLVIATLSILFAAGIITVAIMNTQQVTIVLWPDMPEYTYENTSVAWVIFFSALAGTVFTGIIAVLEGSKIRLSNTRLRLQVRKLQQELDLLRKPSFSLTPLTQPEILPAAADVESEESPEGI